MNPEDGTVELEVDSVGTGLPSIDEVLGLEPVAGRLDVELLAVTGETGELKLELLVVTAVPIGAE